MTSFEIFEEEDRDVRLSNSKGWLIGKQLEETLDFQIDWEQLTPSQAVYWMDNSDGYSLTIDISDSVVSWNEGTIEAICFQADYADGAECIGIKHTAVEDVGEPWGLWVELSDFQNTYDNGEALVGISTSHRVF